MEHRWQKFRGNIFCLPSFPTYLFGLAQDGDDAALLGEWGKGDYNRF